MKPQVIFSIVLSELPKLESISENQEHEGEAKPPTHAGFLISYFL